MQGEANVQGMHVDLGKVDPLAECLENGKQEETHMVIDDDLEQITQKFPDALSYDALSACYPSYLEVPKDYGLHLASSLNHHLASVAEYKLVQSYRNLLGYGSQSVLRQGVKYGFDPAQIIRKGALDSAGSEGVPAFSCTLENTVHPIFRPENFHGCSDAIYEQLKPALRLATLLIFHQATSGFWHTLLFGKREVCEESSKLHNRQCLRIRDDIEWTQEHHDRLVEIFDSQINSIYFYFHKFPLGPTESVYASMEVVYDHHESVKPRIGDQCPQSKICFHSDFYTTARRLSVLQHPDPAMVLRFNFFLAVSICHELSHFLEVAGRHPEVPLKSMEVFFNDNTWSETGITFECKTFGGRIHPVSNRVDCGYGLLIHDWPVKKPSEEEEHVLYTIPMEYILNIQQSETWESDFEGSGPHPLFIPRSGARSLGVNGVNTMVWENEEEEQISDEIDGTFTPFKRTYSGRIVKTSRTPRLGLRPQVAVSVDGSGASMSPSIKEAKMKQAELEKRLLEMGWII